MNQEPSIVGKADVSFPQHDFSPCMTYQALILTTRWKARPSLLSLNAGP
jgi:hypothetical protein